MLERDRRRMPRVGELRDALDGVVATLPIPHDCTDGFLGAHWRSPRAYRDAGVRGPMSAFALLSQEERADGLARLAADLDSGAWEAAHGELLARDAIDLGYRITTSAGAPFD